MLACFLLLVVRAGAAQNPFSCGWVALFFCFCVFLVLPWFVVAAADAVNAVVVVVVVVVVVDEHLDVEQRSPEGGCRTLGQEVDPS